MTDRSDTFSKRIELQHMLLERLKQHDMSTFTTTSLMRCKDMFSDLDKEYKSLYETKWSLFSYPDRTARFIDGLVKDGLVTTDAKLTAERGVRVYRVK